MPEKFVNDDNINTILSFLAKSIQDDSYIPDLNPKPDWWFRFCHQTKLPPCRSMSDMLKDQVILYFKDKCKRKEKP